MSSNTQGIQQLLAAEKRATDKVSAARRRKAKRLKQARDEAEEEIEVFRKEFESKYKEFLKQNAGSTEDVEANMEKDAQRKISEINQAAKSEYEEVSTYLFYGSFEYI
ncbi:hypothetical protein NQ317_019443 [Molorchus minor]|uniref:V-type proton ATPase subunit G n=1 Tax=Molorchus minor TaxID=1323400 RepID=A0ABQ9JZ03_9CUCU|nr:hypothetical protein NQ317_019443 [Molorchus minor]